MRERASTAEDSSDMRVTCLPALRCTAEKSENPSMKFCMSSMVERLRLLLVAFWYTSTSSCKGSRSKTKLSARSSYEGSYIRVFQVLWLLMVAFLVLVHWHCNE